jgi:hypothetical protein
MEVESSLAVWGVHTLLQRWYKLSVIPLVDFGNTNALYLSELAVPQSEQNDQSREHDLVDVHHDNFALRHHP